jgi:hypothetical protein
MKKKKKIMDTVTQFALPCLTISAQIATSLKHPEIGLIINLVVQPFWLHASRMAYKKAGQIGIFVSTIIMTIVTALGIVNYWFL